MKKDIPKVLYKFRTWDDDNHKNMIFRNELFFSSAKALNDPFDCSVRLKMHRGSEKLMEALFCEIGWGQLWKNSAFRKLFFEKISNPEFYEATYNEMQENVYNELGILSMSAVKIIFFFGLIMRMGIRDFV